MYQKLLDHIGQNVSLVNSEVQIITEHFKLLSVKKKEYFLREGSVCKYAGFVAKGCYRNYVISSEGKEINTLFGFENWWMGDVSSFVNQKPSQINCQAMEDTTVLTITAKNYLNLLNYSGCFREYTHKLRSNAHLSAVLKISGLSESASMRHKDLLEKFPGIEQRISQKHIASFLQITPEALSRLRKSGY